MKNLRNRGLRLPEDLNKAIEAAAEAESCKREVDVTPSVIIRTAIVEYLVVRGYLKREDYRD